MRQKVRLRKNNSRWRLIREEKEFTINLHKIDLFSRLNIRSYAANELRINDDPAVKRVLEQSLKEHEDGLFSE